MGERRELNPRVVDSQSTALIHLATSAPLLHYLHSKGFHFNHSSLFLSYLISEIQMLSKNSKFYLLF